MGLGLKGTIIVASEGVNLSIAGQEDAIKEYEDFLFEELHFPDFEMKKSWSKNFPHKRMLVKIRPEIVTMGDPEIDPRCESAPYLSALRLKEWLDEGKDFLLLDTRKEFEYELGSFEGALNLGGKHFRNFPKEVESLPEELKERPVVTFCTGGIRCEKAAPMMKKKGFKEVYQLQGGILKYFEECGGQYWRGQCFVFDHRAALSPQLSPVETLACRSCGKDYFIQDCADEVDGLRMMCPECFHNWRAQKQSKAGH